MKKALALALFALIATPMFASVELNTSISDVFNRGSNELAGSISFNVTSDDFRDASTDTPVYIRITTDRNSVLAETLVEQGRDIDATVANHTDYRALPIHLAMSLDSDVAGLSIDAQPDAVSIVRWVEGESSLWIRVQQSSEQWLDLAGADLGPSESREVEWTFGVSARSSDSDHNEDGSNQGSNLPFNTRNTASDEGQTDWATSTLICVNLSNSNLESDGTDNSLLKYDIISFDEQADIGGGLYSATNGNQNTINYTNDFTIARGKSRLCEARSFTPAKSGLASADLCVWEAQTNGSTDEFVTLWNDLTIQIICDTRDINTLETRLYPGTYIHFATPSSSDYGFFGGDANNSAVLPFFINRGVGEVAGATGPASTYGSGFNNNGRTLHRASRLYYEGADSPIIGNGGRLLSVRIPVQQHYTDDAVEASVDWDVTLFDHDGQRDIPPVAADNDYNGTAAFSDGTQDQDRRCAPSEITLEGETFVLGNFNICTGTPVSLFFPYLPKIVGNSDFWVGLSYVNQGGVDLDVLVHLYDEDGNLFVAEMGSIGTREQRTWLFHESAGVASFTGAGANNADMTVSISSNDPVVDADLAGTTRTSMFVVGTFDTQFFDYQNSGDLDGYMLVGNMSTNSIDGAYLPRNYDNGTAQNADLPINRSKN